MLPAYAFEMQTAMAWIGAPWSVSTNSLPLHLLGQRIIMLSKTLCGTGNHLAERSDGSPDSTSPRATSAPCRSHEVAQLILGPGEALIPVAFSRDLIQNKAGNSFLLGFGESCYFGKGFFE